MSDTSLNQVPYPVKFSSIMSFLLCLWKNLFVFSDSFEIFTAMNIKNCNHDHIILTLFDVLQNFPFTTSEAKRECQ